MDPRMAELIVAARMRELRNEAAEERLAGEARRALQRTTRAHTGGMPVGIHGPTPLRRLLGR